MRTKKDEKAKIIMSKQKKIKKEIVTKRRI